MLVTSFEEKLDPRVKRTRKLLTDAFEELVQEKSLHAITVQDIAERATVNRATFYAHFDDKYALMDHLVASSYRETVKNKLADACGFSHENLALLIEATCEFLSRYTSSCHPSDEKYRPLIETQIQAQIKGLLSRWLEEHTNENGPSNIDIEITSTVYSWAIFGAGMQWAQHSNGSTLEDYSADVVSLILDGAPVP
ncbi:MAG: TetR/AcrR family transcriptional regulator [Chloroflexi bacterium]|nr:TetR/AcrR family transcriptional regulator [Chloroflexota bacterium]